MQTVEFFHINRVHLMFVAHPPPAGKQFDGMLDGEAAP
jgi:hypothetical protein